MGTVTVQWQEDMTSVQVPGGRVMYKNRGGREDGNRDSCLAAALCPTGPSSSLHGSHRSAAPALLDFTRAAAVGKARYLTRVCLPRTDAGPLSR